MHKMNFISLVVGVAWLSCADAAEVDDMPSLEDLLKADITSVSRKSQGVADVPAAAFVISSDDIRRSGALNLPEILRMVPGVEVSRIDNGRYAVSARGFNGRFANKLQVLVDGRSIYLPTFSGVMWENDPIALEDIERIEVIRGPGAAMWGGNAVNGVINIISRHSRHQQGGEAVLGAGSGGQGLVHLRYGGQSDEQTTWRLSAQQRQADPSRLLNGGGRSDDRLVNSLVDFRLDKDWGGGRDFSLWASATRSGDDDRWLIVPQFAPTFAYGPLAVEQRYSSRNLMGRYRWLGEGGVESSLQGGVTWTGIDERGIFEEDRVTYDLDYQARYVSGAHDFVWGASYRQSTDSIATSSSFLVVSRDHFTQRSTGVFVQDDWTLVPDRLRLALGGRLDHSNLGGQTFSPNATLLWTPSRTDTLWGKLARAARLPSRAEQDVSIYVGGDATAGGLPLPLFMRTLGATQSLKPEWLEGAEVGYRKQFSPTLGVDVTAYRYRYKDLRSGSLVGTPVLYLSSVGTPYLVQNLETCNCLNGWGSGAEMAVDWLVMASWRLQLSYTVSRQQLDHSSNPTAQGDGTLLEHNGPRHYGSLRSQWNFSGGRQLDAWIRGSAGFERQNLPYLTGWAHVPGYVTLDLRYAQKLSKELEVAVTGRNLIGAKRTEYISDYLASIPVRVEPMVFVSLRWGF